jgi:hypothetical protein
MHVNNISSLRIMFAVPSLKSWSSNKTLSTLPSPTFQDLYRLSHSEILTQRNGQETDP